MKKIRVLFFISFFLFFSVQNIKAAYITYEDTYSGSGSSFENIFALQKFDSTLGTLQNVLFTWDATLDGSLTVEKTSTGGGHRYNLISFTANAELDKPGSGGGYWSNSTISPPGETVYSTTTWDNIAAVVIHEEPSFTDPSDLAWFTGSGVFNLTLSGEYILSGTYNGTWNENALVSLAEGRVTVKYEYDGGAPVPEPSTFLLFGAGLLGFAGMIRRRNKK